MVIATDTTVEHLLAECAGWKTRAQVAESELAALEDQCRRQAALIEELRHELRQSPRRGW